MRLVAVRSRPGHKEGVPFASIVPRRPSLLGGRPFAETVSRTGVGLMFPWPMLPNLTYTARPLGPRLGSASFLTRLLFDRAVS